MFESQLRRSGGGGAVCVFHRGRPVVDIWGGVRDARGRPWESDTLCLSFSTTKGVTATALHLLADRGQLDYDKPVASYWPEFARSGKADITVRQLLCHEAGLYRIRGQVDHAREMLDWEAMCERLAGSPPAHRPGAFSAYHGLTFGWLVGELVQRVSGRSFQEFVRDELAGPLGLDGLFVGVPATETGRVAELLGNRPRMAPTRSERRVVGWIARGSALLRLPLNPEVAMDALMPAGALEFFYSPEATTGCIPSANGTFTARSLARMYAMLAADGEIEGERVLSTATVMRASEVQNRGIDRVVPFPMGWRLGYHMVPTLRGILRNGFGHFGYGGSGAFADPDRDLSVAMVVNAVAGTPFGDARMLRVGATAVRCAEAR